MCAAERGLIRGEVGTVVEILGRNVYQVEFCDDDEQTYAELALRRDQLIPPHNKGEALRVVPWGRVAPVLREPETRCRATRGGLVLSRSALSPKAVRRRRSGT